MKKCKIVIYRNASHVKSSNNKVNNCYLPQVFSISKVQCSEKNVNGKLRFEPIQK